MRYRAYIPAYGPLNPWDDDEDGKEIPPEVRESSWDLYREAQETVFHIPDPDEDVASTLACRECGGQVFNVGKATYWTGIRCVKCGWEIVVHDG